MPLSLTDRLAIHRTELAVRRTWLAVARTSLALFVTGASFVRFFQGPVYDALGVIAMVASLPVLVYGWWQRGRELARVRDELRPEQD